MRLFAALIFIFVTAAVGCGAAMYSAPPDELPRRAAFDLDCPEASLKTTHLGGDTYGVTGCGRRATYVSMCNGQPGNFNTKCQWLMNTDTKRAVEPAE